MTATLAARRRLPRRYRWRILALVLIPSVVAAPWAVIRVSTASAIQASGTQIEPADVALILGAKVYADGRPSRFLRERVETGVALYLDGTVSQLIMSGDGSASEGHSEPEVMKQIAIDMGVPAEAIVVDPLGVDTYASCLRARDVYGVTSMIVVSQEFHLPRAVWIAERLGLEARGVYPAVNYRWSTLKGHVREVAAVAKAMIDVYGTRDEGRRAVRPLALRGMLAARTLKERQKATHHGEVARLMRLHARGAGSGRRRAWLVAAAAVALSAGCSSAPPAETSSPSAEWNARIDSAIASAGSMGDPQVQLLEEARIEGVLTTEIARKALDGYFACLDDAGVKYIDNGTLGEGEFARLDYLVESGGQKDLLAEGCYEAEYMQVDILYQTQPAAIEAKEARFEEHRSELVACLVESGIAIEPDAPAADVQDALRSALVGIDPNDPLSAPGSSPEVDCFVDLSLDPNDYL